MRQKSDKELVLAIQSGDVFAFEVLVKRYTRGLLSFAFRYVRNEQTAEEIVQDSFFKVYQKIDTVDASKKFSTYLFEITKNTAISALRKQKHELSLEEIVELSEDEKLYETISRFETRDRIRLALSKLEKKYKDVLVLYYFEDLSYEEIQQKLHLSINTVRTHIKRAKEKLKHVLSYEEN